MNELTQVFFGILETLAVFVAVVMILMVVPEIIVLSAVAVFGFLMWTVR